MTAVLREAAELERGSIPDPRPVEGTPQRHASLAPSGGFTEDRGGRNIMTTNGNSKQLTSHDMARNLQLAAEWLLSKDAFEIENGENVSCHSVFWTKDQFLKAVKAIGTLSREPSADYMHLVALIPGGKITVSAPRNLVCRIVHPAETVEEPTTKTRVIREAEYECTPLLSLEEEKQLCGEEV